MGTGGLGPVAAGTCCTGDGIGTGVCCLGGACPGIAGSGTGVTLGGIFSTLGASWNMAGLSSTICIALTDPGVLQCTQQQSR